MIKHLLPHLVVLAALSISAPSYAQATGPATQAAERWFATDLSLGYLDSNGCAIACGPANGLRMRIFYGDADDGPGLPDAVALVLYNNSDEGNGHFAAAAAFRQEGGQYRFVRKLPLPGGEDIAPASSVRFGGGKATMMFVVLKETDARCCPIERKLVAFSMR